VFRSVVVSHDGSRCLEGTLEWLTPLLGEGHSEIELFGRRDAETAGELNSREHLEELAERLKQAGGKVSILPEDFDLIHATHHKLVVVHSPELALELLHESTANIFFTPEGISPHLPKRVLVPLDGSSYAEEILPLLVPLAQAFRPQLELLIVGDFDISSHAGSLMAGTEDPTTAALTRSLEGAKRHLEEQGVDVITHAGKPGNVSRRILEAAAADQADLIAVSSHGHNRLFRWLFGSCAETLIRSGTTPVLVRNTRKGTSGAYKLPLQEEAS